MQSWPRIIETNETAERTIWQSPDARWRVVCSVSLYGLSDRWYALERTDMGWRKIKVHREGSAAWRSVERAIRSSERAARREAKRAEKKKAKARAARRRRKIKGQRLTFA